MHELRKVVLGDDDARQLCADLSAHFDRESAYVWGQKGAEAVENDIVDSALCMDVPWAEGWAYSQAIFDQPSSEDMNRSQRVSSVSVPVSFFHGAHGGAARHWVEFSASAPYPFVEEADKFAQELLKVSR